MKKKDEEFQAVWYTVPEFVNRRPRKMYHKENEGAETDGCCSGDSGDGIKNLHVLARAHYRSAGEGKAERTYIRITADDYYKLYVNGRFAGQGPAPAYPEHYYYNEMDITPYLHRGDNVIAVHLYYQGLVNRVWNSGDGRFGIACRIIRKEQCGGNKETVEPQWLYNISEAYTGEITGYDTQFLENFDSRKWDEDWKKEAFDDRNWQPMVQASCADYKCSVQPVKQVDVYRRMPDLLRRASDGWFADMGEEVTGAFVLGAVSEREGAKVTIRYGEELDEDGRNVKYDMRCGCRYEEIWTLRKGECFFEPYDYKGFRYVQLICEPGVSICRMEAEIRHYPLDESVCILDSGSPVLDRIFEICRNGVKYGTQEGFLDCPTREKGQYLGDAVVSAHAHVWLTGNTQMLRKCVDQFARTSAICPGLMAVAPGAYMQEIADFSLLWPSLLLLDYRFTGDKEFLNSYYPVVKGIIEHFRKYERADGLLEQVADKWNLVDWPENLRDGYDFNLSRPVVASGCHNVINAFYLGAVGTQEKIEQILGIRGEKRSEGLKEAFVSAFYSREKGLFCDSTASSHCALHSNLYPLYFGLCPEDGRDRIAGFLEEKGLCCGVMAGYFYLKALSAAGRYDAVYRTLINETEHGWVNMIREGATACWEAWGKEQKWNTSLCHPWASGPIPVIIEDLAGIIPDPDAETGFHFEPHIPREMKNFSLQFTLRGKQYIIENVSGNYRVIENSEEKEWKNGSS